MGITYCYKQQKIQTFIHELNQQGLKTKNLSIQQVESLLLRIGIFKFKGYLYAFKYAFNNNMYLFTWDDVFQIYFFDKFLSRFTLDLTFSIETLLKTRLTEICYSIEDNPFFYLLKDNYKIEDFTIDSFVLNNWKNSGSNITPTRDDYDDYKYYILYYKTKYDFQKNINKYCNSNADLINLDNDVNYPPFHFLVESATLGFTINLIKHLKLNNIEILNEVGKFFGINNPRTFRSYLDRLKEIRNRAAHRERIFNRSYRSVKGVGHFKTLRFQGSEHRFVDVFLYLYFLLDRLHVFTTKEEFFSKEILPLFEEYKNDRLIATEGFVINKDFNDRNKQFIKKGVLGK